MKTAESHQMSWPKNKEEKYTSEIKPRNRIKLQCFSTLSTSYRYFSGYLILSTADGMVPVTADNINNLVLVFQPAVSVIFYNYAGKRAYVVKEA